MINGNSYQGGWFLDAPQGAMNQSVDYQNQAQAAMNAMPYQPFVPDIPKRLDLGPNQLAWLRANIHAFKQCEAQAQAMIAEAAAARKALGL